MEKRQKVANPEPAKDVSEIDMKISTWKEDIRYITEIGTKQDTEMTKCDDQMVTILIAMMPDKKNHGLLDHEI